MSKNKFILAGLLVGAMALGSACKSTSGAERQEPMEPAAAPAQPAQPPPPPNSTTPGTGGAGLSQDSNPGIGGSGYDDAMINPSANDTSNSKLKSTPDIRDQDPVMDPGTGGSGYEKDGTLFRQDDSLSGDKFPGDHHVPQ